MEDELKEGRVYYSNIQDETIWDYSAEYWKIIAIPRKWWSISAWKEGFSFLKNVWYWVMR